MSRIAKAMRKATVTIVCLVLGLSAAFGVGLGAFKGLTALGLADKPAFCGAYIVVAWAAFVVGNAVFEDHKP